MATSGVLPSSTVVTLAQGRPTYAPAASIRHTTLHSALFTLEDRREGRARRPPDRRRRRSSSQSVVHCSTAVNQGGYGWLDGCVALLLYHLLSGTATCRMRWRHRRRCAAAERSAAAATHAAGNRLPPYGGQQGHHGSLSRRSRRDSLPGGMPNRLPHRLPARYFQAASSSLSLPPVAPLYNCTSAVLWRNTTIDDPEKRCYCCLPVVVALLTR